MRSTVLVGIVIALDFFIFLTHPYPLGAHPFPLLVLWLHDYLQAPSISAFELANLHQKT
jgi:hypothetical protein